MRREKEAIAEAGADVLLVGMGTPDESRAFAEKFDVPFPIVSDPQKDVYRAFDLKRMSPLDFVSPNVFMKGLSAMAQGHHIGLPQGDVRQLPGTFVLSTDGKILFSHYARDPADHLSADALLDALGSAA